MSAVIRRPCGRGSVGHHAGGHAVLAQRAARGRALVANEPRGTLLIIAPAIPHALRGLAKEAHLVRR